MVVWGAVHGHSHERLDDHVIHSRSQMLAMSGSGQEGEPMDVTRLHDPEVPMVKGGDFSCPQALSDGGH
jgi:hypothetical protein